MPSVDPDGRGICINNILSFRTFSAAFCDSSAAACAFAALAAASSKAVAASNLEPRGQSLHVRPASKVKTPCNHLLKKREWNLRCGVMYGGRVSCLFCGRILVTLFLRAENHKEEATRQKDNRSRVYLCTTWEAQWAEQTHAIVQWGGKFALFYWNFESNQLKVDLSGKFLFFSRRMSEVLLCNELANRAGEFVDKPVRVLAT